MMHRTSALLATGLAALLAAMPAVAAPQGPDRRYEQDAARQAMLEGQVMPFSIIKRRVEREIGNATFLGSEFHAPRNSYRLKYVKDGKVVWVDVDGRTGNITGWAR